MPNRRMFLGAGLAVAAATTLSLPASADSMKISAGTFTGMSNHVTSGGVRLIEKDGRYFVELADDFSLDGGPDPRVALGADGVYDPDSKLGALLNLTGTQRYAIPAPWDHAKYNEVYIWCEIAGVPLGVASLN